MNNDERLLVIDNRDRDADRSWSTEAHDGSHASGSSTSPNTNYLSIVVLELQKLNTNMSHLAQRTDRIATTSMVFSVVAASVVSVSSNLYSKTFKSLFLGCNLSCEIDRQMNFMDDGQSETFFFCFFLCLVLCPLSFVFCLLCFCET